MWLNHFNLLFNRIENCAILDFTYLYPVPERIFRTIISQLLRYTLKEARLRGAKSDRRNYMEGPQAVQCLIWSERFTSLL
jgi:hypothetical protein